MSEYNVTKMRLRNNYINARKRLENKVVKDLKSILNLMISNKGKLFSPTTLANEAEILNIHEITGILLAMTKCDKYYCSRFFRDEYYYYDIIREDIRETLPEFTIEKQRIYPLSLTVTMQDEEGNIVNIERGPSEEEKKKYSKLYFRAV